MHCVRRVSEDIFWVGGNDRRLAMFEGVYSVPSGVSYNSYLIRDEKTALMDTVDKAVARVFFENLEHVLEGRALDYIVVHHMEPDHSATLSELLLRHPETRLVCSARAAAMIDQFFDEDYSDREIIVSEGDTLELGKHRLSFLMAPMVHWPEVMVSYESTEKALFSADAFGCFGALNGALFADEVDFDRDYLPEARRYYSNIVGKYGAQVQSLLGKAEKLEISMICPLHGFVWREDLGYFIDKYRLWSSYTPEESGVVIAYASIYGGTENAADILACELRERGIKVFVYDVSVTPAADIVSAVFRCSHLVFASSSYNGGIFVAMDALLRDIAAHSPKNRTIALIENGSWAPVSGRLMRELLSKLPETEFLEAGVSIKSCVKEEQRLAIVALADAIFESIDHKTQKKGEEVYDQ